MNSLEEALRAIADVAPEPMLRGSRWYFLVWDNGDIEMWITLKDRKLKRVIKIDRS